MREVFMGLTLLVACSPPLAPTPASPPTDASQPVAVEPPSPRTHRDGDQAGPGPRAYRRARDPQGGYVDDAQPRPHQDHPRGPLQMEREPDPPHAVGPPPVDPTPPKVECKRRAFEVERCITGGMPRQGPHGLEARRSCATRCESKPPTSGPS
ncbi:MAG: hypothetical protein K0V04_43065, partial [Deltaproteobacteria bacterium]|nr:hypothetical protein [Deltaproteobacteria bacterium]